MPGVGIMTAHHRLAIAVSDLNDRGILTPCGHRETSHLWTADRASQRARAVELCAGCPLTAACAEAADETDETFGVWAAADRTVLPGHRRPNREEAA